MGALSGLPLVVAAVLSGCGNQTARQPTGLPSLHLAGWQAQIQPDSLTITARLAGQNKGIVIAVSGEKSYPVSGLTEAPQSIRWRIPQLEMNVELTAIENRLRVRFETKREGKFTWPVSGADPAMSALIYPDGEGLYIPLNDPFWTTHLKAGQCRNAHGGLSMPFWSYQVEGGTFTYLAVSDLKTEVCISERQGRLSTSAVHDFRKRDGFPPYEIEIWPGGASPISPAVEYRQWLIAKGEYVTLDQKIKENPEVAKLLGAEHGYVYGDGRNVEFLRDLQRLEIDRFWIGYDQDPRQGAPLANKEYVAAAKALGYLIGPYDTVENIQEPKTADAVSSIWPPELYPSGCVIDEHGERVKGFAGRGCELSSQALELAEPEKHYLADRVAAHERTGINSYFLDVDAFGELFDDYSPAHPMTPAQDRLNRLRRMRYISSGRKLVLGSEGGVGWSAPVIAFAHGMESVSNHLLWALMKDKKNYGGWWPAERPAIFFKPVAVSSEFKTAKYDPAYRLPLYQAVFHGSVITTDRWDVPLMKIPALVETRALLELLYNVPSMWSLDRRELRKDARELSRLYRFFSPIHRQFGRENFSHFAWLTADRKVQRTRLGNDLELTANFSENSYQSVPPLCIEARWLKEPRKEMFCARP